MSMETDITSLFYSNGSDQETYEVVAAYILTLIDMKSFDTVSYEFVTNIKSINKLLYNNSNIDKICNEYFTANSDRRMKLKDFVYVTQLERMNF